MGNFIPESAEVQGGFGSLKEVMEYFIAKPGRFFHEVESADRLFFPETLECDMKTSTCTKLRI